MWRGSESKSRRNALLGYETLSCTFLLKTQGGKKRSGTAKRTGDAVDELLFLLEVVAGALGGVLDDVHGLAAGRDTNAGLERNLRHDTRHLEGRDVRVGLGVRVEGAEGDQGQGLQRDRV